MLVNQRLKFLCPWSANQHPLSAGRLLKRRQQRHQIGSRLGGSEYLEARTLLSAVEAEGDHDHFAGVDVVAGYYTWEEFLELEAVPMNPAGSTPTFHSSQDVFAPDGGHEDDVLTIVLDFKDSDDPTSTDQFGNKVGKFDVTSFGFQESQFDMVVSAIMNELDDDFFQELRGTVARPAGRDLAIDFVIGDVGTPYTGASEYYFVQIGDGLSGQHTNGGILGVAASSAVRNASGSRNIYGLDNGAIVASVFTDTIRGMGGLSPSNALTSGNLTYTTNAITGTLSHEIAHTLSLSHINKAGSTQPTSGAAPIMGTGAIDLSNQDRITDREFSLSGVDGESSNTPRMHIQQLVNAVGLHDVENELPRISVTGILPSLSEDADTTLRTKVADFDVTDDEVGSYTLGLSGDDASLFEIDGTELYLIAGAVLDFESNPSLDVTIEVDDPNAGNSPDDSFAIALPLIDVNEAPVLELSTYEVELRDELVTNQRVPLAEIFVIDDALGSNSVSTMGIDETLLELDGNVIYLRGGIDLREHAGTSFSVVVEVDDELLGDSFEDTKTLSFEIVDVDVFMGTRLLNDFVEAARLTGSELAEMGGRLYFEGSVSPYGTELWTSDGTLAGTQLVKDIRNGQRGAQISNLVSVGDKLFFLADDGFHGNELWVSDGTTAGTRMLRDIREGRSSSSIEEITVVGNRIFFSANDFTHGVELWTSDGTESGTHIVKNIRSGFGGSYPSHLTKYGDRVAFSVYYGGFSCELWVSDGTEAGTVLVKTIPRRSFSDTVLDNLVSHGDHIYFFADSGATGAELWRSDGTADGTGILKDIWPGSRGSSPDNLFVFEGRLYFTAEDGVNGRELWSSDGTEEGTLLFKDLRPGSESSAPSSLTQVGDQLYFFANSETSGFNLWVTDGTVEGTNSLRHFDDTSASSSSEMIAVGDRLFFRPGRVSTTTRLWMSDGTVEGTGIFRDAASGQTYSNVSDLAVVGNHLYFNASDGTGNFLFTTDGNESRPLETRTASSSVIWRFLPAESRFYFGAYNELYGYELWSTDGTENGTHLVKDIVPGREYNTYQSMITHGDRAYFVVDDLVHGWELWVTDGDESSTAIVKDLLPGVDSSMPEELTILNDRLYFVATDADGKGLWMTDGTEQGTEKVMAFRFNTLSRMSKLTLAGSRIFFSGNSFNSGSELWVTDGTEAGTRLVKDINPGGSSSLLLGSSFVADDDRVFFTADDGVNGLELWVSDGTDAGTRMVADINVGGSSDPYDLTVVDGRVYFRATDGIHGEELWVSDGTVGGTYLVEDISPGPASSSPTRLTAVGTRLFFSADDGTNGGELWASDGTAAGTNLVRDIAFGTHSANLKYLTAVGDLLYFSANQIDQRDPYWIREQLWVSDGTATGTRLVEEVYEDQVGSMPRSLTAWGNSLIYSAFQEEFGRELWIAELNHALEVNSPIVVETTDRETAFEVDLLSGISDADEGEELTVSDLELLQGDGKGITFDGTTLLIGPTAYASMWAGESEVISYTYRVTDRYGSRVDQTATITILGTNSPATVTFANPLEFLSEQADTTARLKVAEIVITDDGGTNTLSLTGEDAALFEIDGQDLYLIAGALLDFESKPTLDVIVAVDDPDIDGQPDGTAVFSLSLTDVNEAPGLQLQNVTSIPELADTSSRIKVADIVIDDDALGTNVLRLSGADATLFEISGNELYLVAGAQLDFETQSSLNVTIEVDDASVGTGPDDLVELSIAITDVNEAPGIALVNYTTQFPEDIDTSSRIRVADIVVTDDALGSETLSLSLPDSFLFEIVGSSLYFVAGADLDFETRPFLSVMVAVDDETIGPGAEDTVRIYIAITDVNEAPSLALENPVLSLSEDADTSSGIKVADIALSDDALGTNTLTLTGSDAAQFELLGNEVFLRAGANLDFETKPSLNLTIEVDDVSLGGTPDDFANLSISIADSNETPHVTLQNVLASLPENTSTTARIKVADIVVSDDALGTNELSLTGPAADLFEIDGTVLYLRAGASLDFETNPALNITVQIDDAALSGTPDDSMPFSLQVTDVAEGPVPDATITGFVNGKWWVARPDADGNYTSHVAATGPASSFQQTLQGDFNGDGYEDLAVWLHNREWRVGLSDGNGSFTFTTWTTWGHEEIKEIHVGDFNDDGKDDIIGLFKIANRNRGRWWVGVSDGSRFVNRSWGDYGNYEGIETVLVGNFDGLKGDDLTVVATSGVVWMVKTSNTRFQYLNSHRWSMNNGFEFAQVGNFNGDTRDDVLAIFGTGRDRYVVVAKSIGPALGFHSGIWSTWTVNDSLSGVVVGDFDGDGRDNVAGLFNGTNVWYGESNGRRFRMEHWLDWRESAGRLHELMVGDSNGDGLSDIFARSSDGWWHSAESTGSSFIDRPLAEWYAALDWRYVHVGRFASTLPAASNATDAESQWVSASSPDAARDGHTAIANRWIGKSDTTANAPLLSGEAFLQPTTLSGIGTEDSEYDEFSRIDLLEYLDGIGR